MGELQCTKDNEAGEDPELLLCVNERIKWTRNDYVADCKIFMSFAKYRYNRYNKPILSVISVIGLSTIDIFCIIGYIGCN